MPANRDVQRRHRHRDDDRRGHPLQHRDRDEGWADRGTWTHLHDPPRGGVDTREDEANQRSQSTQRSDTAQNFGSAPQGNDQRRGTPERAHGSRMSTPTYKSQGNPRTGSHRGTTSSHGIGGETGGQFGDLHGQRPSGSRREGYHDDDQFGGRRGGSARDQQFGSRRGHGSRRREDPRVEHGG